MDADSVRISVAKLSLRAHLNENPHREDGLLFANGAKEQELLELREAPAVPSPLPGGFFQMGRLRVEELYLLKFGMDRV